jgi:tetratricopeptide (TPR) repeat protein
MNLELIERPQPVGVFPYPAGLLLIPPGDGHDSVRESLLAGKLPDAFPVGLGFLQAALVDDIDGSLARLAELDDDDPVVLANRLVLAPDRRILELARRAATGALAEHVELVAFIVGLRIDPVDPATLDREFEVMARAARVALALQRRDVTAAAEDLEVAAQVAMAFSRPLAGQMLGQLANVQLDDGGTRRAQITFQAALDALADTDLATSRAELHVQAGAMYQEMSEAAPRLLKEAIEHYHKALGLIDVRSSPATYATANANLGLAYMTMPMVQASDQLRVGIAVQAMREALKVFQPDTYPERWSATQLNLANALVYMPSTHQADNIAEAVELYEAVLQHRDRQSDPQGRARVLANQGNALAHLGAFPEAKLRLHEARAIFEEFEEHAAVRSVRSILDEVAKHESLIRQDRG